MPSVALARHAMATRFEIILHGENAVALRAAGEEALDEIERLDAQLSLYQPTSEISRINARAATKPVRVEPGVFRLLQQAQWLSQACGGVFDITVAPLMRCWGFLRGSGQLPQLEALEEARRVVGMHLLKFNEDDFTVSFTREGVMLDLGSIGKGYALERAAELIREAGVTSAMLHGGTSTVCAIGAPPDGETWKIAVMHPDAETNQAIAVSHSHQSDPSTPALLAVIPLRDESLSVSAIWGKAFEAEGKTYGHVIDPRSGQPVEGGLLAAVVLPSATETDALSTALLTLGPGGIDQITGLRPGMKTLAVGRGAEPELIVAARGIATRESSSVAG